MALLSWSVAAQAPGAADLTHDEAVALARSDAPLDERLLAYQQAAATASDADDGALLLREAASRLRTAGRMEEALQTLDQGLTMVSPDDWTWPWLAVLAADVSHRLGRAGRAHALLDELETVTPDEPGYDGVRLTAEGVRGLLLLAAGRHGPADTHFAAELAIAEAMHERDGRQTSGMVLAHLHQVHLGLARNEHDGVVRQVDRLLEDLILYPQRSGARATLRHNQALALIQLETRDPLRPPEAERVLRAVADLDPPAGLAAENALALARLLLDQGRVDEAGEVLRDEQLTGPAATTLAARHARLAGQDPTPHHLALADALEALIARWDGDRSPESGRGLLHFRADRALLDELITHDLAREGDAWAALQRVADVSAHTTLAQALHAPAPDMRALAAGLPEGRGLLIFLPSVSGGSHVFAVDAGGIETGRAATYHELEESRATWTALLTSDAHARGDGEFRDHMQDVERGLADEFSRRLLPDAVAARVASWSSLTLVGQDGIGPFPLAWLPLGDEPYLGVSRAVDAWPGLAAGAALRVPAAGSGPDCALLSGVTPSDAVRARWGDLPALALSDRDATRLLESYADAAVEVLTEDRATPAGLAAACAAGPRVLQLLVHGVQDLRRPRPATLVLSADGDRDGLLHADDASTLRSPPLVVLTGCRTGAGPERRGDASSADLPGAFLRAGAAAVVVSHADLTWGAAVDAGAALHAALRREGASPAEALRRHRAELVEEHGAAAPFMEGLLEVVGHGHDALFEPSPGWTDTPWWTGAAVILAVAAWLLLRRRNA
jgi:tetratricopeptide (TPR) repeat protein